MSRRFLLTTVALLAPLALVASTGRASLTTSTPCLQVNLPTWSPDGTEIVYYGRSWPSGHRAYNNVPQAYCTMNADGTNIQPLPYTTCESRCQDPPGQIVWLQQDEILWLVDGGPIYRTAPGGKPTTLTTINDESFAVDAAKTRIASGPNFAGCVTCSGPVSVFTLATGRARHVGGSRFDNMHPTLSPDGKQVAFERDPATDTGKVYGLWTAHASGMHVRQLARTGFQPFWSPTSSQIAYVRPSGKTVSLRLISAAGGKSHLLVAKNVQHVFGWSPDGKYIAFESGSGTFGSLSVVDVATGHVSHLLQLKYGPTAAWAPDSQELVANSTSNTGCWSTYRVPADGSAPIRISSCS